MAPKLASQKALRLSTMCVVFYDVEPNQAWKYADGHNQLGRGVVAFVRATLGFEQDIMRQGPLSYSAAMTVLTSSSVRAAVRG